MKMQANQMRPGHVIEHEGRRWTILKSHINTPGKGAAVIQVEMRDLKTGAKKDERWRTVDTVERLQTEEREMDFLFATGEMLTLMDKETFEQIEVSSELAGEAKQFLQEGMTLTVDFVDGDPVAVHLPQTVVLEVVEADPVVKGQTAASSYKPAVLANGVRIMVPPFIESGEKVVVRTEDATYVERARG
ncbi:elongation factor P [Elioraea tepida]|jgi:elongation factor P|uniref:Elongation factor P n=1 Tax=Elioraea tepida TaxID=2843330 RepID=A0A975YKJ9_9PROT|nr:elongation factor P [Elioraea tepida]QXM25598.1 elongation factor P [Elioraea tepida]